jgi:uncharacterized protein YndB with AHSA1/START domain
MNDRIEKHVEMKAPVSKVWNALADSQKFGQWFMVKLDGPFVAGRPCSGHLTYPGYEHLKFEILIEKIQPETYFSYKWHPYAIDPKVDYSAEECTLVEFKLAKTATGTLLTVIESGFDRIPPHRQAEAYRSNQGGWEEQMKNIAKYVANLT